MESTGEVAISDASPAFPPNSNNPRESTGEAPCSDAWPPRKRHTPDHPPYAEMIRVALNALAVSEKRGSTEASISKCIVAMYPDLPWGHRNLLPHYLHKLEDNGELFMPSRCRYLLSPPNPNSSKPPRGNISLSFTIRRPRATAATATATATTTQYSCSSPAAAASMANGTLDIVEPIIGVCPWAMPVVEPIDDGGGGGGGRAAAGTGVVEPIDDGGGRAAAAATGGLSSSQIASAIATGQDVVLLEPSLGCTGLMSTGSGKTCGRRRGRRKRRGKSRSPSRDRGGGVVPTHEHQQHKPAHGVLLPKHGRGRSHKLKPSMPETTSASPKECVQALEQSNCGNSSQQRLILRFRAKPKPMEVPTNQGGQGVYTSSCRLAWEVDAPLVPKRTRAISDDSSQITTVKNAPQAVEEVKNAVQCKEQVQVPPKVQAKPNDSLPTTAVKSAPQSVEGAKSKLQPDEWVLALSAVKPWLEDSMEITALKRIPQVVDETKSGPQLKETVQGPDAVQPMPEVSLQTTAMESAGVVEDVVSGQDVVSGPQLKELVLVLPEENSGSLEKNRKRRHSRRLWYEG